MDEAARDVCQAYPVTQGGCQLHPLGNAGGFSGARLWRVETQAGWLCLRAWPERGHSPATLVPVHNLMQQAARSLPFVPRLATTHSGITWVAAAGRWWELATWLPGKADYREHPTRARLAAAVEALAKLHLVWKSPHDEWNVCPGVLKRLERLRIWNRVLPRQLDLALARQPATVLSDWSARVTKQVRRWAPTALRVLQKGWEQRKAPLQNCLCDIWHDHVLFTDQEVTGIVDFGGAGYDSVATDLARLLGSLVGDDETQRQYAIDVYQAACKLQPFECDLILVLDWTGVVVGATNWLRWLYIEGRRFEDQERVAQRLSELVTRMESWKDNADGPARLITE